MAKTTTAPDTADRAERIAAIRREIAAGTYETPEKLSAALDAMLVKIEKNDAPPARPR
ncbi:MAG: flagellar biosynthesis anti-sigma factor FlgM [Planctomycetes bacterium]|nr:flagellar biosynthesis anti-sigma factor FlgM [Planctomycetota bacterium]